MDASLDQPHYRRNEQARMTDEAWTTAAELSRRYARKELSPVELVESTLRRAERLQPHLNFLVLLDADGARAAAHASEARCQEGDPLSPLAGVPTSIQDTPSAQGWRP